MAPIPMQVDSKASVTGKTAALIAAYAGASAQIAVSEGAAAGTLSLAAPEGQLSGLATVTRYLASLSINTSTATAADLTGSATPEEEAAVAEWLARATGAEFGGVGAVGDDKLELLNAHLARRSVLVGCAVTIADLAMYGAVHAAVLALSPEKRKNTFGNVTRWCDFIGGSAGGNAIFGRVPVAHGDFPVLAVLHPPVVVAQQTKATTDKDGKPIRKHTDLPEKATAGAAGAGAGVAASEAGAKKEGGKGGKGGPGGKGGGGEAGAEGKAPAGDAAAGGGDAPVEHKQKEKKEKKEKPPPPPKEEVNVSCLDIRVGTIVKCWEHPDADKLWVESIELGEAKPRQVVSGLRAFKNSAQMTGARVLVLCNVKKGPLRDQLSEGMVMCCSNEDHTVVDFVVPPEGAKDGERVTFAGFEGEAADVLNPKKKMFETCAPKLCTDDAGVACYDGVPFMTSAGPCTSTLTKCHIK